MAYLAILLIYFIGMFVSYVAGFGPVAFRTMAITLESPVYYSLALDSIFNDICTHYLAVYVVDDALVTAQRVAKERASRAADELRRYDVARKVLQAGPTSAERQLELRLREDAARAAVGATAASEKFEALKSLAGAEMRRIHRLYYCVKLRCMVMPTRFAFLTAVPSTSATARQPVPERFKKVGGARIFMHFLSFFFCPISIGINFRSLEK